MDELDRIHRSLDKHPIIRKKKNRRKKNKKQKRLEKKERKQQWANKLRSHQTKHEKILGKALNKIFVTHKFHPQMILYGFIPDFINYDFKIIIEVDGKSHDNKQLYDAWRSKIIKKGGWQILRFSNEEIENDLDTVLSYVIKQTEIIDFIRNPKSRSHNGPIKRKASNRIRIRIHPWRTAYQR